MPTRPVSSAPARRGSFLTGCLIVLAVLVIIAVVAGLWLRANYRGMFANLTVQGVQSVLDKSELSDEQKTQIMAEVEALTTDYKEKRISNPEMLEVVKAITESPLLPLGMVYAVDQGYIQPSTMPDEEKADASIQLQRAARGFYEKSITETELETIVAPISEPDATPGEPGSFDLKDPDEVTVEELREFVQRARVAADEAGIPDVAYQIDIAAELRRAIDRALGRELRDPVLPAPTPAPRIGDEPSPPAPPAPTGG